jgi:hypothetical protein
MYQMALKMIYNDKEKVIKGSNRLQSSSPGPLWMVGKKYTNTDV